MKNISKLFLLAAVAAVVFSCTKENQFDADINAQDGNNSRVVVPAVDGNTLTSFKYVLEGANTKVTVDLSTGVTDIQNGDRVLVYVADDNKATYEYNSTTNKFNLYEGTAVELTAPASVFYPADEFEVNEGVKFIMPAAITADGAAFGDINPMVGVIEVGDGPYEVELKNIASVLRVTVTSGVNINNVVLNYGDGVGYAHGAKFTVGNIASDPTMVLTSAAGTAETFTLGASGKSADVLFIIPTLALTNGLEVTANLDGEHNGGATSFTVKNTSTEARARRTIKTMSFYAGLFSGGTGVDGDPYLITNARDFKNLQKYTVEGYTPGSKTTASFLSAYYQQTVDIDAGEMTPIGTSSNPFAGNYDGDGNTLTVDIDTDTQYTGVFGYIKDATISSLTVEGNVTSSEVFVGGIAGAAMGSHITGCTNNATVSTTSATANAYVGGIVGNANLTDANEIVSCTNSGTITGHIFTGGITGDLLGTADMCINKGIVTSNNSNVGGITGSLRANSVIKRCYSANFNTSTGTPRVVGLFRVGGIVGIQNGANSKVVNCISRSTIIGTATEGTITSTAVGGIVGELRNGLVANCLAGASDSRIINTKTANAYVGLIVGYIQSANGTVQNCYSRQVANNFGYFTYTAPSTFSRKTSAAGNTTAMGQVYGYNNGGTVKDCYYRGHTNGVATGGAKAGSPETNVTMVSANTTTIFNDASANVPVVITLSDGATTYGADTKKLWEILSGGAPLISGYTPVTGELMTWEYKSGSEPIVPSEMIRLGDDFWTN